ncbi:hypothetical protein QX233_11250 [Chryseobacterium gambrini]|uniref:Uncharacterized protein n=1 Tax=Chryseobacterium gambrini TaxID=373672 RepID=A0AAJ1VKQ5_9FLAO|nr:MULTISPECIES: hypothetical protein [Chryseobacterium]MDN4013041.1 hypothetical protein [Chryseobacterium gambrini]MDN4030073.1 hypothetical protein [Chryseobacterium gambrini]
MYSFANVERAKREEGRRKKEEGRRKKEEGSGKIVVYIIEYRF